jgi:hypothetical protein
MLTLQQVAALKAAIVADPVLNALPLSGDADQQIADAFNAVQPDFFVWSTSVDVGSILDAINWPNLTPNDPPAQGTQLLAQTWENRAMVCQIKQTNLQLMLQGRTTINASRPNVRAGLNDALTNIPSGLNGANQNGGSGAVQAVLARKATRAEKLFANVVGGNGATAATAATLVFEGAITLQDVDGARTS